MNYDAGEIVLVMMILLFVIILFVVTMPVVTAMSYLGSIFITAIIVAWYCIYLHNTRSECVVPWFKPSTPCPICGTSIIKEKESIEHV